MAKCPPKNICINLDKFDMSSFQNCTVHSRYSSASKVYERNKPRKIASPTWEMRSAYPLRENIWEYLNGDKKPPRRFNCSSKRRALPLCKQTDGKTIENNKMWLIFMLLLILCIALTYSRLSDFIAQSKFITKVVPKTRLISLLNTEPSLKEECCYEMKSLSASLLRAEEALRNTQRIRRLMMITSQTSSDAVSSQYGKDHIQDATVMKGSDTKEWGSRVALWGVLPLWRVNPPPSTVLATRTPVPSDCWPFSGSRGEMLIELKRETEIRSISIEHVRPDTAKSAPKNFVLYGSLDNGTLITFVEAEYRNIGPAKQFFEVTSRNTSVQKMIFRVLTNQGNLKYTCIYRIRLYGNGTEPLRT